MDGEYLRKFQEDGYVIIPNFLEKEVVDSFKAGCTKLVDEWAADLVKQGKISHTYENEPFETRLQKMVSGEKIEDVDIPSMFREELHIEECYPLFCHPKLISIMQQLMPEAQKIRIFGNYSIRPKLPQYGPHDIVWHQDAGLNPNGSPNLAPAQERLDAFGPKSMINCWTCFVPATIETGCMLAVPGTHKFGIQLHTNSKRYKKETENEPKYGTYATEIDPDVMAKHKDKAVYLEAKPGDIILFSNLLFHRGGFNKSDIVRWSVDWRYQDASKATYRPEMGHIVWSNDREAGVVKDAAHWSKLSL